MILGVGTDIIEVGRIAEAVGRHGQRFLDRIFTVGEQAYCQRHTHSERHFAGRFAAKEAVVKALGTGLRGGISWLDIEILHDSEGKPLVVLSTALKQRFQGVAVQLSISHCRDYATATAVAEQR